MISCRNPYSLWVKYSASLYEAVEIEIRNENPTKLTVIIVMIPYTRFYTCTISDFWNSKCETPHFVITQYDIP